MQAFSSAWNTVAELWSVSWTHFLLFESIRVLPLLAFRFVVDWFAQPGFQQRNMTSVSIQNAGMKMFSRNEQKVEATRFRLSQEGIRHLLPYLGKQLVGSPPNCAGLCVLASYTLKTVHPSIACIYYSFWQRIYLQVFSSLKWCTSACTKKKCSAHDRSK